MPSLIRTLVLAVVASLTIPAMAATTSATTSAAPHPEVLLNTTEGDITLELFAQKSPKTVANFLQYVRSGFYDGTVFHRVIKGYIIQGGGYTRDLVRKPTRSPVPAESDNGLSNLRGTIALARASAPNSGTSQFFINLTDNRRLDYIDGKGGPTWGYTVFGKVIKGMDVVDKIGNLPTHAQTPFSADVPEPIVVIKTATIVHPDPDTVGNNRQAPTTTH